MRVRVANINDLVAFEGKHHFKGKNYQASAKRLKQKGKSYKARAKRLKPKGKNYKARAKMPRLQSEHATYFL